MDGLPRFKDEPTEDGFKFSSGLSKIDDGYKINNTEICLSSNPPTSEREVQVKMESHHPTGPRGFRRNKPEYTASNERPSAESELPLSPAQPTVMITNLNTPTTLTQPSELNHNFGNVGIMNNQMALTYSNLHHLMGDNPMPVMVTEETQLGDNNAQMEYHHNSGAIKNPQSGYLIIPIGLGASSVQAAPTENFPVDRNYNSQLEMARQMGNTTGISKGQKKQLNALKRLGPCANCKDPTHQLAACMICNDEGYMDGCPICNSLDHQIYECRKFDSSNNSLYSYAKKKRENKPPIRLLDDHRNIANKKIIGRKKGRKAMQYGPWTAEFARNNRDSWKDPKNVDMRSKRKLSHLVDPAWNNPSKVPLQISIKDLHLVPNLHQKIQQFGLDPRSLISNTERFPVRQLHSLEMSQVSISAQTKSHDGHKTKKGEYGDLPKEETRNRQPLIQKSTNNYQVGGDLQGRLELQNNSERKEGSSIPGYNMGNAPNCKSIISSIATYIDLTADTSSCDRCKRDIGSWSSTCASRP